MVGIDQQPRGGIDLQPGGGVVLRRRLSRGRRFGGCRVSRPVVARVVIVCVSASVVCGCTADCARSTGCQRPAHGVVAVADC